ncbi:MAG: HAD-IC family P-type ATPase [bacterium]
MEWEKIKIEDVFKKLKTSRSGLCIEEAQKRLALFGHNKIPEPKRLSRVYLFFKQFQNPLVYILTIIIIVSFIISHYLDACFILSVVLINGLVSFVQENKSEKTLSALKKAVKTKTRVIRDGREQEIDSEELTLGDVIIIKAGDKVPADARLIETNNLKINEASLTGEFWAVKKSLDKENIIYLGTNAEEGHAKAIITAIGQNTKIGSLALLVKKTPEEKTPLQKRILEFSRILTGIILGAGFLIFIIGLFKNQNLFMTATALIVSAIPEGLLPVITLVLVVGMRRILKQKGLVRKLSAAETLGSADVICVDKTGTLTTGEMTMTDLVAEDQNMAWQIITKCNEAIVANNKIIGLPTDKALLSAGLQAGFGQELKQRIALLPFDANKKYLASLYPNHLYVAGAPEILLAMSRLDQEIQEEWNFRIKKLAKQGLRLIGLAYKQTNNIQDLQDLDFVGLAVLKDPLRPDVKSAIKLCQEAGIQVVIVTGDHKLTAKSIAQELGFDVSLGRIINGPDITEEVLKRVGEISVFSRVTPEQKLQIVQAWQDQGKITAMTGDGVNDAPALKKADIGIALASGTDVAKEAADLVLLKNSFKTITAAIQEGRTIFENLKKVILYLLSKNFSETILIMLSLIFGLPLPLLPAQILWMNIIEDTFPDFALALEPGEKEAMRSNIKNRQILDSAIKRLILIIGIITSSVAFVLFLMLWKVWHFDIAKIRTMVFAFEVLSGFLFAFSCRSLHRAILRKDILSNYWLVAAVGFGALLLIAAVYLPLLQIALRTVALTGFDWLIMIGFAMFNISLIEILKYKFVIKKC